MAVSKFRKFRIKRNNKKGMAGNKEAKQRSMSKLQRYLRGKEEAC